MKKASLEEVATALQHVDSVLVTSHRSPEGDALGASLGLTLGLRSLGKSARLFNADPCPDNLRFLPDVDRLLESRLPSGPFDAVVICDCAESERVHPELATQVETDQWIIIDHHRTQPTLGTLVVQDAEAPATCELILALLDQMQIPIDRDIATALYTGLAVDTGNFHYSNADVRAFSAATRLVAAGADASRIARFVFEERSLPSLRLLALVLDTLEVTEDGRVASITIEPAMLAETGASPEDSMGLVNYPRALAGCAVAVQYMVLDATHVRVSMRTSEEPVDVESVAKVFGGGGHQHAAGCVVELPLERAKASLVGEIRTMLTRVYP